MEAYELESCVRGHHVYGRVWRATVDEQFDTCDYKLPLGQKILLRTASDGKLGEVWK